MLESLYEGYNACRSRESGSNGIRKCTCCFMKQGTQSGQGGCVYLTRELSYKLHIVVSGKAGQGCVRRFLGRLRKRGLKSKINGMSVVIDEKLRCVRLHFRAFLCRDSRARFRMRNLGLAIQCRDWRASTLCDI